MENILSALNEYINAIRTQNIKVLQNDKKKYPLKPREARIDVHHIPKPITIRRLSLRDKLANNEMIVFKYTAVDNFQGLHKQFKDIKDAYDECLERKDYGEAIIVELYLKDAEAKLDKFINSASFFSGNVFAFTDRGDIVYTSSERVKKCLSVDFI